MGCRICGDSRTVRSHIIAKSFALTVRAGEKHVIAASRSQIGVRRTQAGTFSTDLLCREHENQTGAADKYAVEFVRRVQVERSRAPAASLLYVTNPTPEMLLRFALSTIWRQVHSENENGAELGPYEGPVRRFLFEGAAAPNSGVVVQRTRFTLPITEAMDFNVYPYRARLGGRTTWVFAAAGVYFVTAIDHRGFPPLFHDWRADQQDPCPVPVADPMPLTEVGSFRGVIDAARRRSGRSRG